VSESDLHDQPGHALFKTSKREVFQLKRGMAKKTLKDSKEELCEVRIEIGYRHPDSEHQGPSTLRKSGKTGLQENTLSTQESLTGQGSTQETAVVENPLSTQESLTIQERTQESAVQENVPQHIVGEPPQEVVVPIQEETQNLIQEPSLEEKL